MRKVDLVKSPAFEKAAKTISFDKIVLQRLEEHALRGPTTVSKLVNSIVKGKVMTDEKYFNFMAKEHLMKFHLMQYMAEQCRIKVELR